MLGFCNDVVPHCAAELDAKSYYYGTAAQKNSWAVSRMTPMEELLLMTKESLQSADENGVGLLTKQFLPCMPPTLFLPNLLITKFMMSTPNRININSLPLRCERMTTIIIAMINQSIC